MKTYFENLYTAGKQINWQQLQNKTILITGATGMIGRCLIDFVMCANNNYGLNIKVIAVARNDEYAHKVFIKYFENNNFNFLKHDVTISFDDSSLNNIDFIIHAASGATPNVFSTKPVEVMASNILGIKNLLDLAKKTNAKLVYISSAEIYGEISKDKKSEDDYGYIDHINIRAAYPISKKAAETLAIAYGKEYGISCVICRLSHVFGPTMAPEDNRAASEFIRLGINGEKIVLNNDKTIERSYTYVVDAASAILYIMLNGKELEVYNIATTENITIKEFADVVGLITHVPVVVENISDKEECGYTKIERQVLNIEKLNKLGWKASFKIADGIKNTIQSLR